MPPTDDQSNSLAILELRDPNKLFVQANRINSVMDFRYENLIFFLSCSIEYLNFYWTFTCFRLGSHLIPLHSLI